MSGKALSSRVPRADEWPKPARAACRLCKGHIDLNCDGARAMVMHSDDVAYFVHRACLEGWQKENSTFEAWFAARSGAVFEEHDRGILRSAWTVGASSERARFREKVGAMRRLAQGADYRVAYDAVLALLAEPEGPTTAIAAHSEDDS